MNENNHKKDKIYWHDAFYEAIQLEFYDYTNELLFENEHQLSKEALIMDVLIIKKKANTKIDKNIGRIFEEHNIFEYKSEYDSLSTRDYNKILGYAAIYSSFKDIALKDITISFVVTPKPTKLFDHLVNERGLEIEESSSGIYYVKGDILKAQIIESKKLSEENNVFLKNLRSSLTKRDVKKVLDAYGKYAPLEKVSAYLNRVLNANLSIFKEVLAMDSPEIREIFGNHLLKDGVLDKYLSEGNAAFRETFRSIIYKHFEKDGTIDSILKEGLKEGQEKNKRKNALKMLKKGYPHDEVADNVDMPIEWVQNLVVHPAK